MQMCKPAQKHLHRWSRLTTGSGRVYAASYEQTRLVLQRDGWTEVYDAFAFFPPAVMSKAKNGAKQTNGIHKQAIKNRLTEDSPLGTYVYFTAVLWEFSLNKIEKKGRCKKAQK